MGLHSDCLLLHEPQPRSTTPFFAAAKKLYALPPAGSKRADAQHSPGLLAGRGLSEVNVPDRSLGSGSAQTR